MSRGNYLWERCGTVRYSFYREHPSYPMRTREIREFLISLLPRLPYEFDRIRVVKERKFNRLERIVGHTRVSVSELLEIILATFQARVTPRIAEESANIRRGIFIIGDNEGEGYLVPGKAWFIARIRDLNCRATRGTSGTRGRQLVEICYLPLKID